jgi:arsenate reductase
MRAAVMCLCLFVFSQEEPAVVLFVCEHGSAKSVVAATYFAKLASREGLTLRVISRGTNPDLEIPQKVSQFLISDGFESPHYKPQKLSESDLRSARYVVSFILLPADLNGAAQLETWDIPSFEGGYTIARDSIVNHIERLILKIKSDH